MNGMRRVITLTWATSLVALAGCGAGDTNAFDEFFGAGTQPGTSLVQALPGEVKGVVLKRTADNRILILGAASEAGTDAVAPVVGATIAIPELGLATPTAADGSYLLRNLPPGDYTLRITLPASEGGSTADFKFRLDPGETLAGLPSGANL